MLQSLSAQRMSLVESTEARNSGFPMQCAQGTGGSPQAFSSFHAANACVRAFCLCATANGGRKCGTNALFVVHAAEKFRQFLSPALMPRRGHHAPVERCRSSAPILNVISERQHGITSLSGGLDLSLRADGSQLFMHPKNASLFQGLFKGHFLMRAFTFPKHLWEKSVDLDRPLSLKEG